MTALGGIRVVDFSIWMFGPAATQVLGDFGADVVKVEPPGGEPGRGKGMGHPLHHGMSTRYISRNRNKRSVCVDLTTAEGGRIARALMAGADVVVQNFRPGVAERLGIDYRSARECRPDVIYAAGSGYGQTGPYAHRGGQDRAAQAMSGFMSANGDPGQPPTGARVSVMDYLGGMILAQGVLVALVARLRTGRGQRVDLSLLDAAVSGNTEGMTTYLNTGEALVQRFDPLMRAYQTADGALQIVTVFAKTKNPMKELAEAVGRPELAEDPRFTSDEARATHEAELADLLQAALAARSTADWLAIFDAHGIISAPVYDYAQVAADPQVRHNELIVTGEHPEIGEVAMVGQPLRLSGTPSEVTRMPPLPGEHTDEVLTDLGIHRPDLARWRDQGVIA
ncbi:CaiB/BaiF CoA transferase family protein [Jiangella asiatica]|uniref:CoA transferase n=1 Tax=Jiangella asiatica TaxID=2530372 RepID=A0A4R5CLE4_9ACTN|nr:CoA transferase [Jiangella asiatica]TDE01152.1 CoA transferase [Jiangella asiatica]